MTGGALPDINPNLALIPTLEKEDFEVQYIEYYDGKLLARRIKYHVISSSKLEDILI